MSKSATIIYVVLLGIMLCISIPAQAQFSISGTVTGPLVQPLPNVSIILYDSQGANPIPWTVTDSTGFYVISGLPAATYGVGFEPSCTTFLLPLLELPVVVTGNVTLNASLQQGLILSGYIRDTAGVGIFNMDVNVYDQATGVKLVLCGDRSDTLGYYDVAIPPGTWRIRWRPIGGERYVPIQLKNVVITADTSIDVVLEPGYFVSGTIQDQFGGPVFDCDLDFIDTLTGQKLLTLGDNTDGSGFYQVTVPVGVYDVRAKPAVVDRLSSGQIFGVSINADATVNFTLYPGISLSGYVRDSAGAGVVGADIDVWDSNTRVKLLTPWDKTDDFGHYEVIVPSGLFDLGYQPPVSTRLAPVEYYGVAISVDTVINATVPDGLLLSGLVKNSFGVPVFNADIDVEDPVTGAKIPLVGDKTDILGTFTVVTLPGTYNIQFEPLKSRRLAAVELPSVVLSLDTTVLITLDSGRLVTGTITDSLGAPFADVRAFAIKTSNGDTIFTPANLSDTTGRYEIVVLPDTYDLSYQPDSLSGYSTPVVLNNISLLQDTVIDVTYSPSGNQRPVLITIGNKTTTEGALLTFSVSATDLESIPALTHTSLPTGASFTDHNNGTGTFTWTPGMTQAGSYDITFYATDDSAAVDSETITITVIESGGNDQPPLLAPIGNKLITATEVLSIAVSASDAEGPPVLSTSNPLPGGAVFVDSGNGNGSFVWTPDSTQVGPHEVTFYAQDTAHQIDFETVSIFVSLDGACCVGDRGDINFSGGVDVADLGYIVEYLFRGGPPPLCSEEADVDGSGGIDVSDLTYIVEYLFKGGPPPGACP